MNRAERKAVEGALGFYPGASFNVERTKRHERVVLQHKGRTAHIVKSTTASCPHAAKNFLADVKRALRELDHG